MLGHDEVPLEKISKHLDGMMRLCDSLAARRSEGVRIALAGLAEDEDEVSLVVSTQWGQSAFTVDFTDFQFGD